MKSYDRATLDYPAWDYPRLSRDGRRALAKNRKAARRLEMAQQEEELARLRWEEAKKATRRAETPRQLETAEREAAVSRQRLDEAQEETRRLGEEYYDSRNRNDYRVCYVRLPNGTRCPEPAVPGGKRGYSQVRCARHESENAEIED